MEEHPAFFVFFTFIVYRLLGAFLVQTFFVPDEYWQSLEVAHNFTFGYGYLTWEWKEGIRSCSYPALIALLYKVLYIMGLDTVAMLTQVPRLFHAALFGIGDYYTYKLSYVTHGKEAAKWTSFCIATSWFLFYCSPRTLTNCIETTLTAVGLYLYPWYGTLPASSRCRYLWLAGIGCMLRPTAVIQWLPLYLWHLLRETIHRRMISLIRKTLFIGTVAIFLMALIDRWCFGQWIFTPYHFLQVNWYKDIGTFYGSHPFHWYFTTGFPTIMTIHLIPFILGLRMRRVTLMLVVIFSTVMVFSLLGHKEFRFLLPVMPLAMCICGLFLSSLSQEVVTIFSLKFSLRGLLVFLIVLVNVPLALYTGLYHQRGSLDVMKFISSQGSHKMDVLFLMPCHSTPFYSFVHRSISMRFLTCEPNLDGIKGYTDEADKFFANPKKALTRMFDFSKRHTLPSHIVMFDILYPVISSILDPHYEQCFSAFHTHFPDGRVGKNVHVYCKKKRKKG